MGLHDVLQAAEPCKEIWQARMLTSSTVLVSLTSHVDQTKLQGEPKTSVQVSMYNIYDVSHPRSGHMPECEE